MFPSHIVVTDDLISEFIEDVGVKLVDPEQNPRIFQFQLTSFLYRKGLLYPPQQSEIVPS